MVPLGAKAKCDIWGITSLIHFGEVTWQTTIGSCWDVCAVDMEAGDTIRIPLSYSCLPGTFIWMRNGDTLSTSFGQSETHYITGPGYYQLKGASFDLTYHFAWSVNCANCAIGLDEAQTAPAGRMFWNLDSSTSILSVTNTPALSLDAQATLFALDGRLLGDYMLHPTQGTDQFSITIRSGIPDAMLLSLTTGGARYGTLIIRGP